jgi:hypothetical protein
LHTCSISWHNFENFILFTHTLYLIQIVTKKECGNTRFRYWYIILLKMHSCHSSLSLDSFTICQIFNACRLPNSVPETKLKIGKDCTNKENSLWMFQFIRKVINVTSWISRCHQCLSVIHSNIMFKNIFNGFLKTS